jgi:hypothetical protein
MLAALTISARPLNSKELQGSGKSVKPIVVRVEKVHGRTIYTVESKRVQDPLRALGILVEKRGEDYPVIVLLDRELPLREVTDMEFIADKAGFKNVRSFVFSEEYRDYISAIKFGPAIHFASSIWHVSPRYPATEERQRQFLTGR